MMLAETESDIRIGPIIRVAGFRVGLNQRASWHNCHAERVGNESLTGDRKRKRGYSFSFVAIRFLESEMIRE